MEHLLQQRQMSNYNENIIYCVNKLLFFPKKMKNDIYIHDNDKTIVSLLFHENVIDYLSQPNDYTFYKNFLVIFVWFTTVYVFIANMVN